MGANLERRIDIVPVELLQTLGLVSQVGNEFNLGVGFVHLPNQIVKINIIVTLQRQRVDGFKSVISVCAAQHLDNSKFLLVFSDLFPIVEQLHNLVCELHEHVIEHDLFKVVEGWNVQHNHKSTPKLLVVCNLVAKGDQIASCIALSYVDQEIFKF